MDVLRDERDHLTGPIRIDNHVALYGTVVGSATVGPHGWLLLYGAVTGNVLVEAGGTANLVGTVGGHVINRGGQVTVAGTVGGDVQHEAGQTMIAATAAIAHGGWRRPRQRQAAPPTWPALQGQDRH